MPVSILVLVDVVLEVFELKKRIVLKSSFNPCFGGCCSGRRALVKAGKYDSSFNPCFGGCCSGSA